MRHESKCSALVVQSQGMDAGLVCDHRHAMRDLAHRLEQEVGHLSRLGYGGLKDTIANLCYYAAYLRARWP